jgi:uncharacterized membrane protein YhaH (DUF805 family)
MRIVETFGRFFSSAGRIGPARAALATLLAAAIAWATGPAFDDGYTLAYALCGALLGAVAAKLAAEWVRRLHDTGRTGLWGAGLAVTAAVLLAAVEVSELRLDLPWLYPTLAIAVAVAAAAILLRPGVNGPNNHGEPSGALLGHGPGPAYGARRGALWGLVSTLGGLLIGLALISISQGMREERENTMRYLQQQEAR